MDSDEQRRLFQATASGQLAEIRAILKANPSLLNQVAPVPLYLPPSRFI
jgi:hypothetical protein